MKKLATAWNVKPKNRAPFRGLFLLLRFIVFAQRNKLVMSPQVTKYELNERRVCATKIREYFIVNYLAIQNLYAIMGDVTKARRNTLKKPKNSVQNPPGNATDSSP